MRHKPDAALMCLKIRGFPPRGSSRSVLSPTPYSFCSGVYMIAVQSVVCCCCCFILKDNYVCVIKATLIACQLRQCMLSISICTAQCIELLCLV